MPNYLTLPSGRPTPYRPQQNQNPNPWGNAGDPTQHIQGQHSGSRELAASGLQYAAQQGWGRQLSQNEQNQIYSHAQQNGWDGGDVNSDQYNSSLDYMTSLLGPRMQQQQGQNGTPESNPNSLGSENATRQWQQQAQVAGVPNSFRGANPYAAQQQTLMSRMLSNPGTMNEQWQNQMSESQKESAQRMMQQSNAQGNQQNAGKGFAGGGGAQQAMQNDNQQNMISQLLKGRRDIATQAAQTNRQDELNALNASSQLAGQEFNGDLARSQVALGQMNTNRGANLQDFLGLHSADMDVNNFNQRTEQFNQNYGLDFLRYLAQREQFGQSLGEQGRQYNGQMGLNWATLNANQQQQMMNRIFGY